MKLNNTMIGMILALTTSSSAIAGKDFPIGSGSFNGSSNMTIETSLASLKGQPYGYDISCVVTDPTGDKSPVEFYFAAVNDMGPGKYTPISQIFLDGVYTGSRGAASITLRDANPHVIWFNTRSEYLGNDPVVRFGWVAGQDLVTPISYTCTAQLQQVQMKK